MMNNRKKIYIICTGLGRINRGFESFARECFDTLSGADPELDFHLFKGGGSTERTGTVHTGWNIPRGTTTKLIGHSLAYQVENFTFVLCLLPRLLIERPAALFVSDFFAACYLIHVKKILRLSYNVIFSNGGPSGPPYIFDHVHQLTRFHFNEAIKHGESPDRHTIIPYGFTIDSSLKILTADECTTFKTLYNIPLSKKIVLSVGALNTTHKRMDYVIDEVSRLDNVHLIMLGQPDEQETAFITALAERKLNGDFTIRTVDKQAVAAYYACADVFVLGSLNEGFGRVYIEALSAGLPVCAHDCALTRELLGTYGHFADFTKAGALVDLLQPILQTQSPDTIRQQRHRFAYATYSWPVLKKRYLSMFHTVCQQELK